MGIYDTILLEEGVELPEFPEELDARHLDWQTKDLGRPAGRTYKITNDGRLLRLEQSLREKSPEEKQTEAQEHGFESWEEYKDAIDEAGFEEAADNGWPLFVKGQTVDEEWWADHNQHGTFEFHAASPKHSDYEVVWAYEARFTRGELDEIVFLGARHGE